MRFGALPFAQLFLADWEERLVLNPSVKGPPFRNSPRTCRLGYMPYLPTAIVLAPFIVLSRLRICQTIHHSTGSSTTLLRKSAKEKSIGSAL